MNADRKNDLTAEANAISALGASVLNATDIGTHAIEYAVRNWAVFPLRGKVPAIPTRTRRAASNASNARANADCKGMASSTPPPPSQSFPDGGAAATADATSAPGCPTR